MAFPLRFTYNNCLDSAVGGEGIRKSELDADQCAAAVRAFRARVATGAIGFPTLPEERGTPAAIAEFAAELRADSDYVCVVGTGGSALGAYALDVAMRGPHPVQTASLGKSGKPNGKG